MVHDYAGRSRRHLRATTRCVGPAPAPAGRCARTTCSPIRIGYAVHTAPALSGYSTTMPSPLWRQSSLTSPKIRHRAVHLDHVGAFAGARNCTSTPCGDGKIAVECDHRHAMAGSASLTFRRAGIEQPEQHALAFANRTGSPWPIVVERGGAYITSRPLSGGGPQRISCMLTMSLPSGGRRAFPDAAGIARRLDDEEAVQSRVQASAQVGSGHVVAVIPARAQASRRIRSAACHPAAPSAILPPSRRQTARQVETVPVHDIVHVGIVADIDTDWRPSQAKHRAGNRAVVSKGVDNFSAGEFQPQRAIRSEWSALEAICAYAVRQPFDAIDAPAEHKGATMHPRDHDRWRSPYRPPSNCEIEHIHKRPGGYRCRFFR